VSPFLFVGIKKKAILKEVIYYAHNLGQDGSMSILEKGADGGMITGALIPETGRLRPSFMFMRLPWRLAGHHGITPGIF